MAPRLRRVEQVEQNGRLVLDAARRVFLERGYVRATLEAIADEAGFSKGVVYSQFDSKADLFLALLEQRISERAEQNDRLAAGLSAGGGFTALIELADRLLRAEPEWALLVIEFRVHAARDPKLNERYREAHLRTVTLLAASLERLHERAGIEPSVPVGAMAEVILAAGAGFALEKINNPEAFGQVNAGQLLAAGLGLDEPASAKKKRRVS